MNALTVRKITQIVIAVVLVIILPITLFAVLTDDSSSEFIIIYTAIYISNLTVMFDTTEMKKARLLLLRTLKKQRQMQGEAIMLPSAIKDLVGATVVISTISGFYKGEVVSVEDDWVKLVKVTKKGSNEYFIKAEMIMALTVKRVNPSK